LYWTVIRGILQSLALVLIYGLYLWRLFRTNRGDRFIEFASLTVLLMLVAMACYKIPGFPDWIFDSLMVLLGIMTFASVFFGLQQVFRFLLRRKTKHSDHDRSE
jgi:hypothetical protein